MEASRRSWAFANLVDGGRLKKTVACYPASAEWRHVYSPRGKFISQVGDIHNSSRSFLDCVYLLNFHPSIRQVPWQKEVSRLLATERLTVLRVKLSVLWVVNRGNQDGCHKLIPTSETGDYPQHSVSRLFAPDDSLLLDNPWACVYNLIVATILVSMF